MYRCAVVGEEVVEYGPRHTALWNASVQSEGYGSVIIQPDRLRSVGYEILHPVAEGGVHAQLTEVGD